MSPVLRMGALSDPEEMARQQFATKVIPKLIPSRATYCLPILQLCVLLSSHRLSLSVRFLTGFVLLGECCHAEICPPPATFTSAYWSRMWAVLFLLCMRNHPSR